jgi:hypothetical protein
MLLPDARSGLLHAAVGRGPFGSKVHQPSDGGVKWGVPAEKDELRYPVEGQFFVNRTRDGGKTLEALTKGLPAVSTYDLRYRHALERDGSGEQLVMRSITGSLWMRENQGDSWELITGYLPPIYCVRWR